MQKTNWLRIGLIGFVALAGSTTALVACGGDDDADDDPSSDSGSGGISSGSSGGSSGISSSGGSSGGSSGISSSGGSSGSEPDPQRASLFVVHGYKALGPVRICFASSEEAAPANNAVPNVIVPLPAAGAANDGPPLLPGTGGFLPYLGTDLSSIYIQPYLVKESARLALPEADRNAGCNLLIGGENPLLGPDDYVALRGIDKGALANEKTYVLEAIQGAPAAADDGGADAGGISVDYKLTEVDSTTVVDDGKVGLQFLHAGQAQLPPLKPFIYRPAAGADGGGDANKEFFAGETAVDPQTLAPVTAVSLDAFAPGATGFGVRGVFGETGTLDLLHTQFGTSTLVPIETWSAISDSKNKQVDDDGNSLYYQSGRSFTFIVLGQLGAPFDPLNGQFDGLHALVIPNKAAVVLP